MTIGAGFRKVDLHIHTPKSMCFGDKSVTFEQIIDAALAAGLEAIAVTDHNSVEAIDGIRQVAGRKGLAVFPGVELSARGGHVLALFEMDSSSEMLDDFLDHVSADRTKKGDGTSVTGDSVEEVLQKIDERGGLGIAAHIERWPSGFLETNEPRRVKIRIHGSPYLKALEITIPQNKSSWNSGLMRDFPKKYACVQGSDAHALTEIGRRPVYIRMEQINLDALRSAFQDFDGNIMFPDEFALKQTDSLISG